MNKHAFLKQYLLSSGIFIGLACLTIRAIFSFSLGPQQTETTLAAYDCSEGVLCDWDGVCDSPCETLSSCPRDCAVCGNGTCDPTENQRLCNTDCPNTSNCGNRICEDGEDITTCSKDCAVCENQGNGQYTYLEGCSDHNTANGYNIGLGMPCTCTDSCPSGATGTFTCTYYGIFLADEATACQNNVDDDGDSTPGENDLVDCTDTDCINQPVCQSSNTNGGATTAGGPTTEICNSGIDEDGDNFTDCADTDCFGTTICCNNGIGDGDETGVDCGGSCAQTCGGSTTTTTSATSTTSTAGTTTAGGSNCQDGILNGAETDIDCGGTLCSPCEQGEHCTIDTDCSAGTCVMNGVTSNSVGLISADRTLLGGRTNNSVAFPVVNSSSDAPTSADTWYENKLLIKFKESNDLLLPTYADDMIGQAKERYIGYLLGKITALYEQKGVSPLMMVRAVDQLFDYRVQSIDHVYTIANLGSRDEGLAYIYRITIEDASSLDVLIAELKKNIAIEFIEKEPVYTVSYTDPQAPQQWFLGEIEADKARDAGASGNSSAVVAVIDNGFDLTHSDLQGALVPGWDAADNDSDPQLPTSWLGNQYGSHGTHTIGLAGAVTDNAVGIASVGGGISIMPIKATRDIDPPLYVSDPYAALQYAVSRPEVDVISMSFGSNQPSSTLESIINAHPEKIFVAAAGNDNESTPQYPAAYSNVIAVAALNTSDDKASFSNYGNRVDIASPGVSILSTVPQNGYANQQGTSMATPIVASALGLLVALGDTNPRSTLEQTADDLPNSSYFTNNQLGAGRLNICNAVITRGIACNSGAGGTTTATTSTAGGTTAGGNGSLGSGICQITSTTTNGSTTATSTTATTTASITPGGTTATSTTATTPTTTTSSTTSNSTSTTAGSINSGDQYYPLGAIDITVDYTTIPTNIDTSWTLMRSYVSGPPSYPTATLDLYVNLPQGLDFVPGSQAIVGDGDFLGYTINAGDPTFVIQLTGLPAHTSHERRVYTGTIQFKTDKDFITQLSGTTVSVESQLLCYGLSPYQYVGTATCSTSSNWQSAVKMSTDKLQVKIAASSSTNNTNTNSGTQAVVGGICGDGSLGNNEICDDGNTKSGDGCSGSCMIEYGWRCLPTSPSQCGTDECFTHGEVYTESNIFASCCGGLSDIAIVPSSSAISTGTVKSHICYDSSLGQPTCDTRTNPSGRWISTQSGSKLVLADSCRSIYKDYYKQLLVLLQSSRQTCLFTDIPYDQVSFKDITSTKQKVSISMLRDACIVQGVSKDLDTFAPKQVIQRAELMKMVIKLLMIAEGNNPSSVISASGSAVQFMDVPASFWGAGYIQEAQRRGLLAGWTKQGVMTFFKPYASVTREEMIALMRRISYGDMLTREEMESILGPKTYFVSRAQAAEIVAKKFLPVLHPYFYFKGEQEEYYRTLAEKLKAKTYQEQYGIILEQIEKLHAMSNGEGNILPAQDFDPYRMEQFLRQLLY